MYSNSALNPVIYSTKNRKLLDAIHRLFFCQMPHKVTPEQIEVKNVNQGQKANMPSAENDTVTSSRSRDTRGTMNTGLTSTCKTIC